MPRTMKKNLLHFYILTFVLFSDFVMFAQPATDDEDENLEGEDPAAPINSKLIYLAIIGILFAVYKFKQNKRVA